MRRNFTFPFPRYRIPHTLFSGFAYVSFLNGNKKCDFAENKTTCAITDTRLGRNVFFRDNLNRQIAISEFGRAGAIKGFPEYMQMAAMAP